MQTEQAGQWQILGRHSFTAQLVGKRRGGSWGSFCWPYMNPTEFGLRSTKGTRAQSSLVLSVPWAGSVGRWAWLLTVTKAGGVPGPQRCATKWESRLSLRLKQAKYPMVDCAKAVTDAAL